MDWQTAAILLLAALLVLLLVGIPIAVCLGIVATGAMMIITGPQVASSAIGNIVYSTMSKYSFLAIPLFVVMGDFLIVSGTVEDLHELAAKWLRQLPGGLALVSIAVAAMFATLSGSSVAAVAALGAALVPGMLKRGYDDRLATGAVGSAGGLAMLIPPSIQAILYAIITEGSPARQLVAGLIPGLILAVFFVIVCIIWVWIDPKIAPKEDPVSWAEKWKVLKKGLAPLIIVFAVLGTIILGITTAIEAAALGALAAFILAILRRKVTIDSLKKILYASTKTTSFIIFIVIGAMSFGWVLTYYLIPQHFVEIITGVSSNKYVIIAVLCGALFILGMFLDLAGMMLITTPIFLPIVVSCGFSPIWWGVIFVINGEMALITPPVGFTLYILKGIAPEVPLDHILWGCARFFTADIALLILLIAFPSIVLWLPNLMFG